jgi:hypothetical protein
LGKVIPLFELEKSERFLESNINLRAYNDRKNSV